MYIYLQFKSKLQNEGVYPFEFRYSSGAINSNTGSRVGQVAESLPIIFSNNTPSGYTDLFYTSVRYHEEAPHFSDEIKIALPLTIFSQSSKRTFIFILFFFVGIFCCAVFGTRLHILFTFYHISCKYVFEKKNVYERFFLSIQIL